MSNIPVITIDGPSGSGKGEISRHLAIRLGWHLLDSGAVYRAFAVAAQDAGFTQHSAEDSLVALARQLPLEFITTATGAIQVWLAGKDISKQIRDSAIANLASYFAAIPAVRTVLATVQRQQRQLPGLVADGRDMGTVIFPDATLKLFLTADFAERARRRFLQLQQLQLADSYEQVAEDLRRRDERDMQRAVAPLKADNAAVVIDTTTLTIEQVVNYILNLQQLSALIK